MDDDHKGDPALLRKPGYKLLQGFKTAGGSARAHHWKPPCPMFSLPSG
jgi:hypothetical protein